jgi:hypothetical protein
VTIATEREGTVAAIAFYRIDAAAVAVLGAVFFNKAITTHSILASASRATRATRAIGASVGFDVVAIITALTRVLHSVAAGRCLAVLPTRIFHCIAVGDSIIALLSRNSPGRDKIRISMIVSACRYGAIIIAGRRI